MPVADAAVPDHGEERPEQGEHEAADLDVAPVAVDAHLCDDGGVVNGDILGWVICEWTLGNRRCEGTCDFGDEVSGLF